MAGDFTEPLLEAGFAWQNGAGRRMEIKRHDKFAAFWYGNWNEKSHAHDVKRETWIEHVFRYDNVNHRQTHQTESILNLSSAVAHPVATCSNISARTSIHSHIREWRRILVKIYDFCAVADVCSASSQSNRLLDGLGIVLCGLFTKFITNCNNLQA